MKYIILCINIKYIYIYFGPSGYVLRWINKSFGTSTSISPEDKENVN